MSGGHFDYNCFRISQFADELKRDMLKNKSENGLEFAYNFSDETILNLKKCHEIIETAGKLAKEIEWLYSGDIGEKLFNETVDPITKEQEIYAEEENDIYNGYDLYISSNSKTINIQITKDGNILCDKDFTISEFINMWIF